MIFDLRYVNYAIKRQGLQVCITSFGGSCTNTLKHRLERNGYRCFTKVWDDILCHCRERLNLIIPQIYVYNDPRKAFLSMKRRGMNFWGLNQQKLANNYRVPLSDDNLLQQMFIQFYNYTRKPLSNRILIIHQDELFQDSIVYKLRNFLGNPALIHFPVEYRKPKTEYDILYRFPYYANLFAKYKRHIDNVNNYQKIVETENQIIKINLVKNISKQFVDNIIKDVLVKM